MMALFGTQRCLACGHVQERVYTADIPGLYRCFACDSHSAAPEGPQFPSALVVPALHASACHGYLLRTMVEDRLVRLRES